MFDQESFINCGLYNLISAVVSRICKLTFDSRFKPASKSETLQHIFYCICLCDVIYQDQIICRLPFNT